MLHPANLVFVHAAALEVNRNAGEMRRGCVAVGGGGVLLVSPDGETWSMGLSGTKRDLFDVVWSGSGFIAASRANQSGPESVNSDAASVSPNRSSVAGSVLVLAPGHAEATARSIKPTGIVSASLRGGALHASQ